MSTPIRAAVQGREPEQPAPGPALAERRLVSVLFADLVGFTSLSETRDAEEVRDLLMRFAEVCRAVVERYGGFVDNFIGDAVFAVWGATIAHEDDAERAVRCGLELIEAISVLGGEVNAPGLAARAGVMTGEAAINRGGMGERMVAGDLVNTASRLQNLAEPRSVLVGEGTYTSTNHAVAYLDAGELVLKGKEETVHAFRALRVVAQRQGVGRPRGIEAPFVGRVEELRSLKDALDGVGRDRRARLVSVTGIPGIGKSRLAWEFQKYVDGLIETIYWHHGRSPAYGEGISFWALAEMIRMRAGITEDEEHASSKKKLADSVAEFVADHDERSWIEARLAHLLGLSASPLGAREETFSAWRTFFERISERAPVVMVFEDLQWADSGLIDFIEFVLEWSKNHPILVVALARPELFERRPNWGAGQRSFTSLHLESLDNEAMGELLKGMIEDIPSSLASAILERAEGVPLYAVEIVRMLSGNGLLSERNGIYEVTGELTDLEVPGSLHALIASRLDSLPDGERALIQDAAVLGKSFSTGALTALTARSKEELEAELRDLARKEFLSVDIDPRSPERGQYGFLQSVIREVAYSTLSRKDRREKHLAAATYYESLADAELAGVVAAHYLEAHRASPEGHERDELGSRARESLAGAAERAISLGDPEQARSYLEQALEISSSSRERAELALLAGNAAQLCGASDRALELFERARGDFESTGDSDNAGRAVARAAITVIHMGGQFDEARQRAEHTYESLGADGDPRVRAELAQTIAELEAMSGDQRHAHEWAERALEIVDKIDAPETFLDALQAKAHSLFAMGRHKEALILYRGGAGIAETTGLLVQLADYLTSLSVTATELRESLDAAHRAVTVARRGGARQLETINLLNVVEFSLLLGEWETARSAIADVDALHLGAENLSQIHYREFARALLEGLTGDIDKAMRDLERLGQEVESEAFIHSRATYLWYRALLRLITGDFESAHADAVAAVAIDPAGINAPSALQIQARSALWLRDEQRAAAALAAIRPFQGRRMVALRQTVEAGIVALRRDLEQSVSTYADATRAWRELESPLDLALCQLDMAFLLDARPEAAEAAAVAREAIESLGVTPLLDRLADSDPTSRVPSVS
ncbi:MAG: adenylate/guanylate cyclase domain-containing protein [Acidimicrobiales bacterium]